jgi:hypothetical protein
MRKSVFRKLDVSGLMLFVLAAPVAKATDSHV